MFYQNVQDFELLFHYFALFMFCKESNNPDLVSDPVGLGPAGLV